VPDVPEDSLRCTELPRPDDSGLDWYSATSRSELERKGVHCSGASSAGLSAVTTNRSPRSARHTEALRRERTENARWPGWEASSSLQQSPLWLSGFVGFCNLRQCERRKREN
jgi:hypothetical protein